MPFRQASQQFEYFTKVEVNESTIRHATEQAGAVQVEIQDNQVGSLQDECPESPDGPDLQMMSVDGAFVQLVAGEWKEVKTLAVGEVGKPVEKNGERVIHTQNLSYYSRMREAKRFTEGALVEIYERGVEKAGKVCAVTDGAEWIQTFVDSHRNDAIRILDFAHAMEYVSKAGKALVDAGLAADLLQEQGSCSSEGNDVTPLHQDEQKRPKKRRKQKVADQTVESDNSSKQRDLESEKQKGKQCEERWEKQQAHELKHGEASKVIEEIKRVMDLVQDHPQVFETIKTSFHYLNEREPMMDYARFQAKGYPIGSGCVESANKLVVENRMKGAGMRWAGEHVDPMLALRNMSCSNRWNESWKQIRHQIMVTVQEKRAEKAAHRLQARQSQQEDRHETPKQDQDPPQKVQVLPPSSQQASPVAPQQRGCPPSPTDMISPASLSKPKVSAVHQRKPAADHPWRRPLRQRPAS
jgi:hypothetical protein